MGGVYDWKIIVRVFLYILMRLIFNYIKLSRAL